MVSRRVRVVLYAVVIAALAVAAGNIVSGWLDSDAPEPTVREGLGDFLEPWKEAVRNQAKEPATVVVVGDSISEGTLLPAPLYRNRFVGLLQDKLRDSQKVGGGAGWLPAYYADPMAADDTLRSGPPSREYRFRSWGLGGRALFMPAEAGLTYPEETATTVRVWFGRSALFGGQGKVVIDGEDMTARGRLSSGEQSGPTINGSSPSDESGLWWTSPPLTRASHVVQVLSVASGRFFVHTGVQFFDGDENSGIRVVDASHSGATAADFANDDTARGHWRDVAALDPHLVLINLGSNAESDYPSSLETVVSRALAAAPRARILLVDGYEPGTWDTEAWQAIRKARADVAARHPDRVRVFDMAAQWPTLAKDGSTSEGLMAEETLPLHPSAAGNVRMAEIFADLLIP